MMTSSLDRRADAANEHEETLGTEEARANPRPAPTLGGWQPVRLPVGSHITWITVPDYSTTSPNISNPRADRRRPQS